MHRVNVPQFIKLTESCAKIGMTIYAEGPPGVGKSKSILDWARKVKKRSKGKFGICYLDGANASLMDICGVLMKHERTYKGRPPTIQPDEVRRLKHEEEARGVGDRVTAGDRAGAGFHLGKGRA